MKKIAICSVLICMFVLMFFGYSSYALHGGKVIGAQKVYCRGGVSYSSSGGTNSTSLPIGIGYGFTNDVEGLAAVAIMNIAGVSATGFQLGIQYQMLKDNGDGMNLSFNVPFTNYSILGAAVNQTGLIIDISKDMQGILPYLSFGAGVTQSGPTSITSYPLSVGFVIYPASNFEVYGSIGTVFSSSGGTNPLNLSAGTEIKI